MVKSSFKHRFEKSLQFRKYFQLREWILARLGQWEALPVVEQGQGTQHASRSVGRSRDHVADRPVERPAERPGQRLEQHAPDMHLDKMTIDGINDSHHASHHATAAAESTAESTAEVISEAISEPSSRRARKILQLPPPHLPEALKPWRWSLVWLAALGVLGGMGTAALIWLVSLPPQVDCRNPERLSLDMEKLYCAQVAAQTGELPKLIDGIQLLTQWTEDHPLQREAQRLINEWSDQIFTIAIREVEKGNIQAAESAIGQIPSSAPVHADAQKAIERWRKYGKSAADLYATAETALKNRDWATASQQVVRLAEFERDYWKLEKGADALVKQLGMEKQAWQTLIRAQKLASGSLQQVGQAIPLAQQVPTQTYAAETARADLKRWSQKLLTVALQQWQKGDRAGTLKTLALTPQFQNTPEVADLYRFSQAYQLAESAMAERWEPSVGELLNLNEAIAALRQVPANSPFYAQAQALQNRWKQDLEDLVQLKYASMTADWKQSSALGLAIGQAKLIEAKRPRRVQAQSMIAYWRQETERLEDQPILNRAERLAENGTIEALQSAIAQAGQIKLGRALRQPAQTLIATWRSQIQTLEDRPKLARAEVLAEQGDLTDAIGAASEIQPGRALYPEAQRAIRQWRDQQVVEAQIAQDQPILDRANALANSGNLAEAIRVASGIGSGRALSGQAQTAINRWERELYPPAPTPDPSELQDQDRWSPTDRDWFDPAQPDLDPNNSSNNQPTDGGADSFPSPSPGSTPTLPDLQLVPPTTTYEPLPQPGSSSSSSPVEPAAPSLDQPTYEPAPPVDPLPPESADPLPPSPTAN